MARSATQMPGMVYPAIAASPVNVTEETDL
jgi:hypothetical protein